MLAGRSEKPAEVKPGRAPQARDTVDVLVAETDIGIGQTVIARRSAMAGLAGERRHRQFHPQERPARTPSKSSCGAIARAPFVAGEPIREAKLINAKGSGFMAAILPSGMRAVSTQISPETGAGGFILPNDRVDVILTRRDREAEKTGRRRGADQRNDPDQRARARDRPDRRGEERPERRRRQDRDARADAAPGRDAGAGAAARHAVAGAAQHRRCAKTIRKPTTTSDRRSGGINIVRFGVSTTATPR